MKKKKVDEGRGCNLDGDVAVASPGPGALGVAQRGASSLVTARVVKGLLEPLSCGASSCSPARA